MEEQKKSPILYGPARKPWRETLSEVAVCKSDGGRLLVSPPTCDPLQCGAPAPEGITLDIYQVPSSGLSQEEHELAMAETETVVKQSVGPFLGFMSSYDFELPSQLRSPIGSVMLNSGGDPFQGAVTFPCQVKWMEQNVLDYYASLWNARWPWREEDEDSYWGYILAMGSTEGNLHALWSARNNLSRGYLPTQAENHQAVPSGTPSSIVRKVPVVFLSRFINYTLYKCCDIVNIATFDSVGRDQYPGENPLGGGEWVAGVPCTGGDEGPGTIDIDALEKLVDFFSSRGHPIVVVFSYGTTVKGACDDVKLAGERLVTVLKNNGMYELTFVDSKDPSKQSVGKGFWFHVDGALSAAYMPFLEMAYKNGLTDIQPAPLFDFRLDFVMSIVTSGHKFLGIPWPCGVYLVRSKKRLQEWSQVVTLSTDSTISLSRNGHSTVALWSYISTNSYDDQVATVLKGLRIVKYAVKCFAQLQERIGIDLWVMNSSPSLSVVFRRPNNRIVEKYTLCLCTLCIESQERPVAQIYAMKHVTTELIDALMNDLSTPDAFLTD